MVSKFLFAFLPILPILAHPGPSRTIPSNLRLREINEIRQEEGVVEQDRLLVSGYSINDKGAIELSLSVTYNGENVCPYSTSQCSGDCNVSLYCNEGYEFNLPPSSMTGPKFFEFYGPEGLIVQGYLNPVCYGIPTEAVGDPLLPAACNFYQEFKYEPLPPTKN